MVLEFLEPILNVIIDLISLVINEINAIIKVIVQFVSGILKPIMNILKVIFDFLSPLINSIASILSRVIDWVAKLVGFLSGALGQAINFIANVLNKIAPVLEKILNVLSGSFLDKMSTGWRVAFDIATGGVFELGKLIFGGFATGGFPEGGLFMANHNELIGRFDDGRTVVANNEQITQGIYMAVKEALGGGRNTELTVYLDGREIAKAVDDANNNKGSKVLYGGNLNYGK